MQANPPLGDVPEIVWPSLFEANARLKDPRYDSSQGAALDAALDQWERRVIA